MDITTISIMEIFLFFVTFPFVFQAFNAFDTSKIFKKGYVWQIQIIYIFSSIIFTYLFIKAIINLIQISANIFS